jgi:hypothetical protein
MISLTRTLLLLGLVAPAVVFGQGQGQKVNPGNSGKGPDRFAADGAIYQQRATIWLTQHPLPDGMSLLNSAQRYVLACIYFATYNQPNKYTNVDDTVPWVNETKWLSDSNECEWAGIECNYLKQITMIDLGNNGLAGVFPLEVQVLGPSLEYLDISQNVIASLSGSLTWLGALTNVKHLDIHFTNLDYYGIPPYMSKMTSLEFLDMSYTFFYGPLDGTVFTPLTNLTYLEMGGNYYEFNPVPDEIASLPNLKQLYMEFSYLSGDLSFIELLNPNMIEMWLDINNFDGTIPTAIGELTGLVGLSLTGCMLAGPIPTEIGQLKNLTQLWLYNNTLTGTIPTEIGGLAKLKLFQSEDNSFDGIVMPSAVCDLVTGGKLEKLSTDCTGGMDAEVQCAATCCGCCEPPCFVPVVEPPPQFWCFSGQNTIDVANKGTVLMADLEIGDEVHVGDGEYSRVYSFGHYNKEAVGDYLQIHGPERPLEITKDHMVFVENRGAVAAASVAVGDNLVLGSSNSVVKVTKIDSVQRAGAFAPFTETGTIVVNDVLASSYVSLQDNSEYFSVGGVNIVSMHFLAHVFQAPHRLMCKLNADAFCTYETYTTDGISNWVYAPYLASQWLLDQHAVIFAALSVPVLMAGTLIHLAEVMFTNVGVLAGAVALVAYLGAGSRQSKKMSC